MNIYNWTCRFVKIDQYKYKCQLCDKIITSYDLEPPIMLCNYLVSHHTPSNFGYTYTENQPELLTEEKSSHSEITTSHNQPSLLDKAINFSKAAVSHAMKGSPKCTEEEIELRYKICKSCDHFDNNTCKLCGCSLVRERIYMNKLAWADQSCPIKKWGPISRKD